MKYMLALCIICSGTLSSGGEIIGKFIVFSVPDNVTVEKRIVYELSIEGYVLKWKEFEAPAFLGIVLPDVGKDIPFREWSSGMIAKTKERHRLIEADNPDNIQVREINLPSGHGYRLDLPGLGIDGIARVRVTYLLDFGGRLVLADFRGFQEMMDDVETVLASVKLCK